MRPGVFHFFQQRNQRLRSSPTFLKGDFAPIRSVVFTDRKLIVSSNGCRRTLWQLRTPLQHVVQLLKGRVAKTSVVLFIISSLKRPQKSSVRLPNKTNHISSASSKQVCRFRSFDNRHSKEKARTWFGRYRRHTNISTASIHQQFVIIILLHGIASSPTS